MKRSGTADLPLHYGKVPAWLYERMSSLGRSIVEVIFCSLYLWRQRQAVNADSARVASAF